jgi:signal transduction histidine kinase
VLSSKAYLQSLLNSTGDAIWSLDRDRKIVWMNEQMQRTVQLAYGETVEVGSRPIPIVGEIEALRWDAWFDAAFAGDVVRTIYKVPNGDSPLTFDVRFNPVRINDEIDGVVVVARDITAEKRIEQQLIEQRDKAEQMNKLKSSFLANMSHEIRTPLTSIIGYADLLCAELKEREHAKYATSIEQSGRRLLTTINEILDLAKIQAGTMQPELKHASIDTSIENVVTMLMPIARANRLWLQYQPSQAPLHAMTDTQLLERVLVNVIGNALKFTEEGGVYIQLELMQGSFLIRVSDTGIGIDPEFLPFVFDEFKQQSVGYNRKYEGTGLGLTITRKLMCLLGGSITIKETSPRGTIFELSFPLYTEATPPSIHS